MSGFLESLPTEKTQVSTGKQASDPIIRINNAIKIYDQKYNRTILDLPFKDAMTYITKSGSELIQWMAIQQLIRQVDYMKHIDLVGIWMKDMTIKWFVYKYLPKEKQGNIVDLWKVWRSFEFRASQDEKAILRAFAKELKLSYKKELEEIWTKDPSETMNLWTKVEAAETSALEESKQPKVALS